MKIQQSLQNTNQSKNNLFSNQTAAEYIGVSAGRLEVWRSTKRYDIQYIRVGRLIKYRQSALDDFLERRTIGAGGEL